MGQENLRETFAMRLIDIKPDKKHVVISMPQQILNDIFLIIGAAKDKNDYALDDAVGMNDTPPTGSFDELIAELRNNNNDGTNEPVHITLTVINLRHLSMLLETISDVMCMEDHFPSLLEKGITDEKAEEMVDQMWKIRNEAIPSPPT